MHVISRDFGTNKTPVEIIKEDEFGGTYFRDIYSGVNGKLYKKSWKEFVELKNIDQKYYSSNYNVAKLNKYQQLIQYKNKVLQNKHIFFC